MNEAERSCSLLTRNLLALCVLCPAVIVSSTLVWFGRQKVAEFDLSVRLLLGWLSLVCAAPLVLFAAALIALVIVFDRARAQSPEVDSNSR